MQTTLYNNLDEKPAVLLWSASQLWQRQRKASLRTLGLTLAQYITLACLRWLGEHGQVVTQASLAQQSKLDVMHTSRIVRTLEQKGLLTRAQSGKDPRAKYLQITPEGMERTKHASAIVNKATEQFFAPIKAQETEFVALMQLLVRSNERTIDESREKIYE